MVEINFDGIPGPTHNYAGLSPGNLAAEKHARTIANPREAALQGLSKARALAARGIPQAVLPPHERPDVHALRNLGFQGSEARILADAAREAPQLLAACSSAAAMWTSTICGGLRDLGSICYCPGGTTGRDAMSARG